MREDLGEVVNHEDKIFENMVCNHEPLHHGFDEMDGAKNECEDAAGTTLKIGCSSKGSHCHCVCVQHLNCSFFCHFWITPQRSAIDAEEVQPQSLWKTTSYKGKGWAKMESEKERKSQTNLDTHFEDKE